MGVMLELAAGFSSVPEENTASPARFFDGGEPPGLLQDGGQGVACRQPLVQDTVGDGGQEPGLRHRPGTLGRCGGRHLRLGRLVDYTAEGSEWKRRRWPDRRCSPPQSAYAWQRRR